MVEKSKHLDILWCLILYHILAFYEAIKPYIEALFRKPKSLQGQVALVTGGANGLGRELCFELAAQQANIAVVDIDIKNAEKVAQTLRDHYKVAAEAFKVDISDYSAIVELKKSIESTLGPVDILVNNAALLFCEILDEVDPKEQEKFNAVNINSHLWTIKIFLPGMIERKRGHVVGMSSIIGFGGVPMEIAYAATKFAIRGLMLSLRQTLHMERQDSYIKTTLVVPTLVETDKTFVNWMHKVSKIKPTFIKPKIGAETVVQAIRMDESEIWIPKSMKYFKFMLEWESLWKSRLRTMVNIEECRNRDELRNFTKKVQSKME